MSCKTSQCYIYCSTITYRDVGPAMIIEGKREQIEFMIREIGVNVCPYLHVSESYGRANLKIAFKIEPFLKEKIERVLEQNKALLSGVIFNTINK